MADLREVFDRFDALVGAGFGVAPADAVEAAAEVGRAARRRAGYLGDTLVVALAGGTGSGKSSLLNALAGEEVSEPGAKRPTTAQPVAWMPANPEPGLVRLLDDLGVDRRVGQTEHPDLAILDLPDIDSVIEDNRLTVERLVPLVDAVVWVVDPEKYKDSNLHDGHLKPLASRSERFLFALNQIDRVDPAVVGSVEADLAAALVEDGIADPVVVRTAGDPPLGIPVGLDELLEAVRSLGSVDDVVRRRIIDEIAASADRLLEAAGGTPTTGLSAGWTAARDATVGAVDAAITDDLRHVGGEVARSDARAVSSFVGGREPATALEARAVVPPATAVGPLRSLLDSVATGSDPGLRAELVDIADGLEAAVTESAMVVGASTSLPLGPVPSWWNSVRLLSFVCAVAVVSGIVLAVGAVRTDGTALGPVLTMALGLTGIVGLRVAVGRSARHRVDAALGDRRSAVRTELTAELERRVGRPARDALRARSGIGAAHTELMLIIHRLRED